MSLSMYAKAPLVTPFEQAAAAGESEATVSEAWGWSDSLRPLGGPFKRALIRAPLRVLGVDIRQV